MGVFSAESLKNTDWAIGNKSDPYIKIHLQKPEGSDTTLQDKKGKAHHITKVVADNLNPEWNQDFRFVYCDNVKSLRFEVWDSDYNLGVKEDDFLGEAELERDSWEQKEVRDKGFYGQLQ